MNKLDSATKHHNRVEQLNVTFFAYQLKYFSFKDFHNFFVLFLLIVAFLEIANCRQCKQKMESDVWGEADKKFTVANQTISAFRKQKRAIFFFFLTSQFYFKILKIKLFEKYFFSNFCTDVLLNILAFSLHHLQRISFYFKNFVPHLSHNNSTSFLLQTFWGFTNPP